MSTDVHKNKVSKDDKMLLVRAYIARARTHTLAIEMCICKRAHIDRNASI